MKRMGRKEERSVREKDPSHRKKGLYGNLQGNHFQKPLFERVCARGEQRGDINEPTRSTRGIG